MNNLRYLALLFVFSLSLGAQNRRDQLTFTFSPSTLPTGAYNIVLRDSHGMRVIVRETTVKTTTVNGITSTVIKFRAPNRADTYTPLGLLDEGRTHFYPLTGGKPAYHVK